MTKAKYPAIYVVETQYEGNKGWDLVDFFWTRKEAIAEFTNPNYWGEKVRILKYKLEGVIKES